jgi:hypothetical protein
MNTWWRGVHRETTLTCFHFSIVLYKLLINVYVDRLLKHIEVIGYNIFYWKDRTWKGKLLCRLMQPYHWSYKLLLEIASMFEPGRCLEEAATWCSMETLHIETCIENKLRLIAVRNQGWVEGSEITWEERCGRG